MVTQMFSRNLACKKYGGNIVEAVVLEVKLCDEVEAVRMFKHLDD